MPEEVAKQAAKELRRLENMPEASTEHSMVRTYLDWLVALPWSKLDAENIDIARAREILDADHYGLDKVKRRILEYLAVRKLNAKGRSPILCFVGPPGVGKTSLGQSIARALGLKFVRSSLGGVHDEAEIRGHRRTYIGSLPGNIMQSLRKAGTRNPVFMLDEMDKLGVGFHGDPSAALLEVLDPEQNSTFRDHYLDVPFDSEQGAVRRHGERAREHSRRRCATAWRSSSCRATRRTRSSRSRRATSCSASSTANGLKAEQVSVTEGAIAAVIDGYTREAGVRSLERNIGALLRHAAMKIAEGTAETVVIDADDVATILGARRFENEVALRTSVPGVATGLAWTPVGGDILFIEASLVPGGKGHLILTGQLGDVMKESAQAAVSLAKMRMDKLGVEPTRAREERPAHPLPGGRDPEGRPERGRRDVPRGRVAPDRPHGARRRRDDGRDQSARPRAADRRRQGKDARGAARGHRAR